MSGSEVHQTVEKFTVPKTWLFSVFDFSNHERNTVIDKACHSIEVATSTWTCIKHLNTVLTSERLCDGKTKVVVEGYGDQVEEAEDKQAGTVENLVQSV